MTTSIAGDVVTALNLTARVQLVDASFLRVTAEVGAAYRAVQRDAIDRGIDSANVHCGHIELEKRGADGVVVHERGAPGETVRGKRLLVELGAHESILECHVDIEILGEWHGGANFGGYPVERCLEQLRCNELALDNVAAWSVLVGRDQRFGRTGHLRVGVGYRRQPGILVLDSYGNLMVSRLLLALTCELGFDRGAHCLKINWARVRSAHSR